MRCRARQWRLLTSINYFPLVMSYCRTVLVAPDRTVALSARAAATSGFVCNALDAEHVLSTIGASHLNIEVPAAGNTLQRLGVFMETHAGEHDTPKWRQHYFSTIPTRELLDLASA